MELEYRLLSDEELATYLETLPDWSIQDGMLAKEFRFGAYLEGIEFAKKVGETAEGLDHHPDILIGYRKVRVAMNTHDVGGLSPYDIALAMKIEEL